MIETLKHAVSVWALFWSDGYVAHLFAAAVLLLLLLKRKNRTVRQLLLPAALALLLFFFPLTARLLMKMVGDDIYWRILWIVPVFPILAFAGTELARRAKKLPRFLLVLLLLGVTVLTGKDMYQAGNYTRLHNLQQVPEEVPHICNLLHTWAQENGLPYVYAAADDHLATWLRIYDPTILMPYGRYGRDARNVYARALHSRLSAQDGEFAKITNDAKLLRCRFLIVPGTSEDLDAQVASYGCPWIGRINDYHFFYVPPDSPLTEIEENAAGDAGSAQNENTAEDAAASPDGNITEEGAPEE